ncbi:hypothetical protein P170DRAFT_441357 [Aspergillus steynii IBT 23096]|uniref:Uncharacterized protein n=1 Tax=Aspergillus steynii IBT 23096 TaxID=1392250 RepID=A0A2I2FTG5_9EURO|nr:uncharacterized protein P170DRAFT_441357 [Aspergillus steynii IBT 23096]PLB43912.1 hypothetical protein P170DRAFT_441357 [Aspergillus steynii IBT 23096]
MQKAKAEAEEAARGKSENADDSESNQDAKASQEGTQKDTPKPADGTTSHTRTKTSGSSRSKHQKTKSEAAREATFASLQRALNAAVAARERYGSEEEEGQPGATSAEGSVSPTAAFSVNSNQDASHGDHHQSGLNSALSEWDHTKDASMSWTSSHSSQGTLGYGSLNATPLTSAAESLAVPSLDGSQHQDASHDDVMQNIQFHPSEGEEWAGQMSTKSLSGYHSTSDAEAPYHTAQYHMQPELSLSRRESSDELADTLEGIGIHANRADSSWKDAGKELDLAARRKRPRPAAIGTSRSSSMLAGSASMSPTTSRLPNYGSGHGVRQSKSAQCLNSRYAGVRKASAAQRSPLNLSTFAEAGALASSKAEMSSMLQPTVTTGALAPPTPLTPEDFHHLLPTTPSDGGYCLSAQPTSQLFPTTQPMQANIASPPATPLAVDIMGSYPYQGVAPPMSAPAHYTSFPDYAAACDGTVLTGRSWTDATSMPSPEAAFQSRCAIPQGDIPSMSYEHSVDSVSGSPTLVYPTSDVDMPTLTASLAGDAKPTEFYIHEFPEQQEAHRFVAQQLPQKPKAYTFTNQTPNDFPN